MSILPPNVQASMTKLTGDSKASLALELIHAVVVLSVVIATAIMALISPKSIPSDTVGVVFGAAIGYASGRAGTTALIRRLGGERSTDR